MGDLATYILSDFILFSSSTYYRQFEIYNQAIWPLHMVAVLFACFVIYATWKKPASATRVIAAVLMISWLWVAYAFLYQRFYQIHVVVRHRGPIVERLVPEVCIVELRVMTTLGHQISVISLLDDPTVIYDNDAVSVLDRRQPMGDDDGGPVAHDGVQSFLDLHLGEGIDTGRRLIQDKDCRIL